MCYFHRITGIGIVCFLLVCVGCDARFLRHMGKRKSYHGPIATRSFPQCDFSRINVHQALKVTIHPGNTYQISVKAPEDMIQDLSLDAHADVLEIRMKEGIIFSGDTDKCQIEITTPKLKAISASGASSVFLSEVFVTPEMEIELSGASHFEGSVETNRLTTHASGASSMHLSGSAEEMKAEASGASKIGASNLKSERVDIHLSGASDAGVNVRESLTVEASGCSHVSFHGNPKTRTINTSGASSVTPGDPE